MYKFISQVQGNPINFNPEEFRKANEDYAEEIRKGCDEISRQRRKSIELNLIHPVPFAT